MRRFIIAVAIFALILPGCGGKKSKYNAVMANMQKLLSDLQEKEKVMDGYMQKRSQPESTCVAAMQVDMFKERAKKIRADLDALRPKDMPTVKKTEQDGTDPTTGQPVLETTEVIDWGKVTGDDQRIWANLNTAEYALATAAGMLSVGCQCIDGKDENAVQCSVIGLQLIDGRFTLELDSVESAYLKPAKELVGKL